MVEIKEASIGFGNVRYISKVDEIPETTQRDGNVTIVNKGRPGQPGYFETSFTLSFHTLDQQASEHNVFTVRLPINLPHDSPYSEIEGRAAEDLPAVLRAIADEVERLVEEAKAPTT